MQLSPFLFSVATAAICFHSHAEEAEREKDPVLREGLAVINLLEPISEWTSLFNGKDLTGWRGDTKKYVVKDGVLVCEKGGKVLETEQAYSDFAFRFEFKLSESGNNGLGIRVPAGGHASRDGMELQILDHRGSRYVKKSASGKQVSKLKPWQMHGSVYGAFPAKTGYLKPLDDWNEQVVICVGSRLLVILNGALIVDTDLDNLTALDGKARPGLKRRSGHLQFAGHNDRIEFRGMEIAPLASDAAEKFLGDLK